MPPTPVSRELRYEDYSASDHRPAFDGLRGLGFLLVVTAHVPSVPLFDVLHGWTGVWTFLVMSGYLVTMLMMREEKRAGRVAFGSFLVRRFFRIVPSYWMAILLYWLACYALPPLQEDYPRFVARLPAYLAFMPEYADTDGFSIFTHAWTVGVELKFYLVFPPVLFPWPPLAWLGQRSYGAYLLHFLALRIGYILFGVDSTASGLLAAGFCLALTLPAAELMYRTIERPGRESARRLVGRAQVAVVR